MPRTYVKGGILLLKKVTIGDFDQTGLFSGLVHNVFIDGHPKVKKLRVLDKDVEWFRAHKGEVVDLEVYAQPWSACGKSGILYRPQIEKES